MFTKMLGFGRFNIIALGFLASVSNSGANNLTRPSPPTIELLAEIPDTVLNEKVFYSLDGLENRIGGLLNSPDRIGFGSKTSGGTKRLVEVTSPDVAGPGTLDEAVKNARSGDYIIFDPSLTNVKIADTMVLPADVTVDGRTGDGGVIKIVQTANAQTFRMDNGNNILNCLSIDAQGAKQSAVAARRGENYWFNHINITNSEDDAISLGHPRFTTESVDMVTISNYKVTNSAKGVLLNSSSWSCKNVSGMNQEFVDQRRAHVSLFNSFLSARERNPTNFGGYLHVWNTISEGWVNTGSVSSYGAQTIFETNIYDTSDAQARWSKTIESGAGPLKGAPALSNVAPTALAPSCPVISQVFTDSQEYRGVPAGNQKAFELVNSNFVSGSQILNRREAWNTASVKPFNINYNYNIMDSTLVDTYVRQNAGVNGCR